MMANNTDAAAIAQKIADTPLGEAVEIEVTLIEMAQVLKILDELFRGQGMVFNVTANGDGEGELYERHFVLGAGV
jgi:hypothetical protein